MPRAAFAEVETDTLALLHPVDPTAPAASQIFTQLRSAILSMAMTPGQPLSEPEIGARLGVSRTPVREAFAKLRAIDLVMTLPSRGSYVTKLNEDKIREAQYLREALETATVRRLIDRGLSDDSRTALSNNLADQKHAVANKDRTAFHVLDDRFHLLLAKSTGFPRAATVLEQEKAQLDRLRVLSLRDDAHFANLYEEHRQICDSIFNQDLASAMGLMVPHLRSILTVLGGFTLDHADYFNNTPLE